MTDDIMTKKISLTQLTYESLKEFVVTGRLAPGLPLNIREIGAQLGVSSGAVREALSRLSAERLVVSEGRGFRIAPITIEELEDLGRTRAEIEGNALRRSIEIGGEEWEQGIHEAMRQLKATPLLADGPIRRMSDAFMVAYESFYGSLISACDRVWLNRVQEWLSAQANRSRSIALATPRYDNDIIELLEELMTLTLARDADRAVALLTEHIMRATHRLIDSLAPALGFLESRSLMPVERITATPSAVKKTKMAKKPVSRRAKS